MFSTISISSPGFVNSFLSWKAFIPLGRLTYCAYLVHPIIMYTYIADRKDMTKANNITFVSIRVNISYGYFNNININNSHRYIPNTLLHY